MIILNGNLDRLAVLDVYNATYSMKMSAVGSFQFELEYTKDNWNFVQIGYIAYNSDREFGIITTRSIDVDTNRILVLGSSFEVLLKQRPAACLNSYNEIKDVATISSGDYTKIIQTQLQGISGQSVFPASKFAIPHFYYDIDPIIFDEGNDGADSRTCVNRTIMQFTEDLIKDSHQYFYFTMDLVNKRVTYHLKNKSVSTNIKVSSINNYLSSTVYTETDKDSGGNMNYNSSLYWVQEKFQCDASPNTDLKYLYLDNEASGYNLKVDSRRYTPVKADGTDTQYLSVLIEESCERDYRGKLNFNMVEYSTVLDQADANVGDLVAIIDKRIGFVAGKYITQIDYVNDGYVKNRIYYFTEEVVTPVVPRVMQSIDWHSFEDITFEDPATMGQPGIMHFGRGACTADNIRKEWSDITLELPSISIADFPETYWVVMTWSSTEESPRLTLVHDNNQPAKTSSNFIVMSLSVYPGENPYQTFIAHFSSIDDMRGTSTCPYSTNCPDCTGISSTGVPAGVSYLEQVSFTVKPDPWNSRGSLSVSSLTADIVSIEYGGRVTVVNKAQTGNCVLTCSYAGFAHSLSIPVIAGRGISASTDFELQRPESLLDNVIRVGVGRFKIRGIEFDISGDKELNREISNVFLSPSQYCWIFITLQADDTPELNYVITETSTPPTYLVPANILTLFGWRGLDNISDSTRYTPGRYLYMNFVYGRTDLIIDMRGNAEYCPIL